jgi:iron complex outermembrane recepter protein
VSLKSILRCSVTLSAILASTGIAFAAGESDELQEVIVTANKTRQNIKDVPQSILVIDAETLERENVRSFEDLMKIAPSVTLSTPSQPVNNSVNIRGIGTFAVSLAAQASTAVVIDDVPQFFTAEAFTSLNNVSSVEILRGPQSTLFGKAASAGVILITTKQPSDHFTADITAMATGDHEDDIQASVSGPITDKLSFLVSGVFNKFRGLDYNLTTGNWLNGQQDQSIRTNLTWKDGDWKVSFTPYFNKTISSCCVVIPEYWTPALPAGSNSIIVANPVGKPATPTSGPIAPITPAQATPVGAVIPTAAQLFAGITQGSDNHLAAMDTDERGDSIDYGAGLKVTKDLSTGHVVTLISSIDHYEETDLIDNDGTDENYKLLEPTLPNGYPINGGHFWVTSVTDEIRLNSPAEDKRLTYVAGFYFSDTKGKRDFVRGSDGFGLFSTVGVAQPGNALVVASGTNYSSYLAHSDIKTEALYGQASYQILNDLTATAGVRFHHEDESYQWVDRYNNVSFGYPACSTSSPQAGLSNNTCTGASVVLGKGALQYKITPDFMVFTDYSTGYKGPSYDLSSSLTVQNGFITIPTPNGSVTTTNANAIASAQPVPGEHSDNIEIGFKGTLFSNKMSWNATGFMEKFTNFQAQTRNPNTSINELASVPKVTSKGFETEVSARPFNGMSVSGSGTYDLARFDSYPLGGCWAGMTVAQGCVPYPSAAGGSVQNQTGQFLPNAPRWSGAVNAEYDFHLTSDYTAFFTAVYHWQSLIHFSLNNGPDSIQKSYGTFNLAGGIQRAGYKITVFVNNMFDKHYSVDTFRNTPGFSKAGTSLGDVVYYQAGRDSDRYAGVRLSASF